MANTYSWDGSWNPGPGELPPDGLIDPLYFDMHLVRNEPSPILPPGNWDFFVEETMTFSFLANYRNFNSRVGHFEPIVDESELQFGWRLVNNEESEEYNAAAAFFQGSSGLDYVDSGPEGTLRSTGEIRYAAGPDMIRIRNTFSSDWRTGSSLDGAFQDNDLVLIGEEAPLPNDEFSMFASSLHTGPGRDLVFVNNWERAGVDLGLGADGRTDTLDPEDGADIIVFGGNWRDNRIVGGAGDDVFVWFVDEINIPPSEGFLGGNIFGGGAWTGALWDNGTDRLVFMVPADTAVTGSVAGNTPPGTLEIRVKAGYPPEPVPDPPTEGDVFARYFLTAGIGPNGERTHIMVYHSADSTVNTAEVSLTSVEEVQIGVGPDARVYKVDPETGTPALDETLQPLLSVPDRAFYTELFETFLAE
ncbi:MAG: hypothetical protein HYV27_13765 [Candidatus Hydrogenedentes bacterium]|nr:hypothetical protein [Candidatus Hydrogenedentota bacterium]